jgi:hypothetical protein
MTAKQANREGRPWQRKSDGRWSVRAYPPGQPPKMVYGASEDEVLAKQAEAEANRHHDADPTPKPDVRITLNLKHDMYRQLRKWMDAAADEIGTHQVSQQDAIRAMITAAVLDKSIGLVVIDLLRRDGQH